MRIPPLHEIEAAYEFTGLVPAMCGPELHRLADGRFASGPLVAVWLHRKGVPAHRLNEIDIAHVAEQAEAWSISQFGSAAVAGFLAGFDNQGLEQIDGAAACSLPELLAYHDGQWAGKFLSPVNVPTDSCATVSIDRSACRGQSIPAAAGGFIRLANRPAGTFGRGI